ncbi:hypothetical protein [Enterococcus sp. AZ196]|uniref:hypothetical protein n=1 Tax=Enterococcus sp. AZ196 TaxID=2774659 RepID=UPI003D287875
MKRMWTRSLVVAIGASIFLYSEHVFATTAIYDPLDPQNTITPVPNEDHEMSDYLLDDSAAVESSEINASKDQKAEVILEKPETDESSNDTAQAEDQLEGLLPDSKLKQKEAGDVFLTPSPYLPKLDGHPKNQVLMLDDDFFFSMNTVVVPPDSGGGSAGAPNDFSDLAQSAYLLSGVVLYGEASGKLTPRVSDHFA